jgi:hypothetical protein
MTASKTLYSRTYSSLPANVTQEELNGARKYCSDLLRFVPIAEFQTASSHQQEI